LALLVQPLALLVQPLTLLVQPLALMVELVQYCMRRAAQLHTGLV
jgi:hypothetical protein